MHLRNWKLTMSTSWTHEVQSRWHLAAAEFHCWSAHLTSRSPPRGRPSSPPTSAWPDRFRSRIHRCRILSLDRNRCFFEDVGSAVRGDDKRGTTRQWETGVWRRNWDRLAQEEVREGRSRGGVASGKRTGLAGQAAIGGAVRARWDRGERSRGRQGAVDRGVCWLSRGCARLGERSRLFFYATCLAFWFNEPQRIKKFRFDAESSVSQRHLTHLDCTKKSNDQNCELRRI